MDEFLKDYTVEIDPQALQQVKQIGHVMLVAREEKFEYHIHSLLLRIISREIRLFMTLAILQTMLLLYYLQLTTSIYMVIGFHSALLGAYMIFELFRTFRFRMAEIQYPTKIGMNRLFLYKAMLILMIEFILICILMLNAFSSYGADGYQLLAYGILPNFMMCTLLFLLAGRLHSIFVMLLLYGGGVSLIYAILHQFILLEPELLLSPFMIVLFLFCSLFYIYGIVKLQMQLKHGGGQFVWN